METQFYHRITDAKRQGMLRNIISLDAPQFLDIMSREMRIYLLVCRRSLGWSNFSYSFRMYNELTTSDISHGYGLNLCVSEISKCMKLLTTKNVIFLRKHNGVRYLNINVPGILKHYIRTNRLPALHMDMNVGGYQKKIEELYEYSKSVFDKELKLPSSVDPSVWMPPNMGSVISIEEMLNEA